MLETNLLFYQKLDLQKFKYFAEVLGLDNGADIEFIYPELKHAQNLLELGAGYGRVIDKLLQLEYKGEILAVERIDYLIEYLDKKFGDRVQLFHTDIRKLDLPQKVDCIIWSWSGILELNKKEQAAAVKQLKNNLTEGGKLIVETPHQKVHAFGKVGPDNLVKFETEWGVLEAYLCTEDEVRKMAEDAKYTAFEKKIYKTDKGLERVFYLLSN